MNQKKQRIGELDLMKLLIIFLVVISHSECPEVLDRYISMIHMPLFFMISGFIDMLPVDLDWIRYQRYCIGKIKRLYVPFVISAIAFTSLHNYFFRMGINSSTYETSDFIIQFVKELFGGLGLEDPVITHLWFLRVLFVALSLRALLFFVFKNRLVDFSLLIMGLCALLMSKESIGSSFFWTQIVWPLRALFYIVLGKYLFKYYRQRQIVIVSSLLFLMYLFVAPYCPLMHYFHSASGIHSFISALSGLGVFISLFYLLKWLLKHHSCSMLLMMGRKTMSVYILHYPIVLILPVVFDSLGYGLGVGGWILLAVLSFSLSFLIGELWSRITA